MKIKHLRENWNKLGETDPLWAVLTYDGKENKKWNVDEFFETGEQEIKEVLQHLESLPATVTRAKALDFGCAVGRLTQALATRFDEVYGIDIAPSMIEQAKRLNKHGNRCKYILNEVDHLGVFGDSYFDFIYSNITLQHMKPIYIRKYLAEFIRTLKPGGVVVFQLPSERLRGATRVKRIARFIIPENVIEWIFHARIRWTSMMHGEPVMEMYGIQREKVVDFLMTNGLKILETQSATQRNSVWLSYRYYAIKTNDNPAARPAGT